MENATDAGSIGKWADNRFVDAMSVSKWVPRHSFFYSKVGLTFESEQKSR